jgi:hypothetical protein
MTPNEATALVAKLRQGITPGPWKQDSDHDICGPDGWLIACPSWPDIYDTHVTWPQRHADARLIVAAPVDALAARVAELEARPMKVRALEWECTDWSAGDGVKGENDCEWQAVATGLHYIIDWQGRGTFCLTKPDDLCIYAGSLADAKSSAQADYEARVMSALEVPK